MTFLDRLNLPKFDFTQNRSGSKIIKFQQSQAVTSHFEIFWSIVQFDVTIRKISLTALAKAAKRVTATTDNILIS